MQRGTSLTSIGLTVFMLALVSTLAINFDQAHAAADITYSVKTKNTTVPKKPEAIYNLNKPEFKIFCVNFSIITKLP